MAASNLSDVSVRTNSHLPVACSEVDNSASVDQPRSRVPVNITSSSCSPWQSAVGRGVLGNDRDVTAVKAVSQPSTSFSLQSDAAPEQHHRVRSSETQMPCYDVGNSGESIINLRADHTGDDRWNTRESRLSRDGDMTVADASPSTEPGFMSP